MVLEPWRRMAGLRYGDCRYFSRDAEEVQPSRLFQLLGSSSAHSIRVGLRRQRRLLEPVGLRNPRADEHRRSYGRDVRDGEGAARTAGDDDDAAYMLPPRDRAHQLRSAKCARMAFAHTKGKFSHDSAGCVDRSGVDDAVQAHKGRDVPWLGYDISHACRRLSVLYVPCHARPVG